MKSTSGAHYIALDHIRAVAALLVFVWHFMHGRSGYPVPFTGSPIWGPLVLFDEGHVGVALFMTLSGYLFAKILDGKKIKYGLFIYNRILRLFPLLVLVIFCNSVINAVDPNGILLTGCRALALLAKGLVYPVWPNGGWSITIELHFYLLLPILLFARKWGRLSLLLFIVIAMVYRWHYFITYGSVQSLAYSTIFGRIDQFVFGILAFHGNGFFKKRHFLISLIAVIFLSIYYWFDTEGGYYLTGGYPSASSLWIWLPTVEGITFASMIAWYETSFNHGRGILSVAVSRVGEYSYSIYLLHFFVVFAYAKWINLHLINIENFYVALPVAVLAFISLIPVGYLSMRYIEKPFLRLRQPYC